MRDKTKLIASQILIIDVKNLIFFYQSCLKKNINLIIGLNKAIHVFSSFGYFFLKMNLFVIV